MMIDVLWLLGGTVVYAVVGMSVSEAFFKPNSTGDEVFGKLWLVLGGFLLVKWIMGIL